MATRMTPAPAHTRAIAAEAYTYGFPLVDHYRIQHSYFIDKKHPDFKAPWNKFYHTARVVTPEDISVKTPVPDTLNSYIGADLRWEPLVVRVPPIEKERYYSLQFIDAYTFNFAYAGSRTTGHEGARILLAGPDWSGEAPTGITHVIRSETQFAFVLCRIQLFNSDDLVNVRKLHAIFKVQRLSDYLIKLAPRRPREIEFPAPLPAAQNRTSLEFFNALSFVLQFCPPHPSETDLLARLASIGIHAGERIDFSSMPPLMVTAVQDGMADAWHAFDEFKRSKIDCDALCAGDLVGTRESLQNNYLYRMAAAVVGLYGNSKEEALAPIYRRDADGRQLDGTQRYTLHFDPQELPPVNAFWSLTLYQLPTSLLYANALNRYVINSAMLPAMQRDADGGVTVLVQHDSPGPEREANWLPAPHGQFFVALRLYWPKREAVNGNWIEPPLRRAETGPGLS